MQKPADLANSGTSTARDSHLFCVNLVNLVQVSGLYERTAGHPRLIPKGMACTYVRSEGKGIPRQHHESYGGGERQRRQRREREREENCPYNETRGKRKCSRSVRMLISTNAQHSIVAPRSGVDALKRVCGGGVLT